MTTDISTIQTLEEFKNVIKSCIDGTNNVSDEDMHDSVSDFLEQTGLIEKSLELLKDELLCAVCHEIPLSPRLTQCRHIFCGYCLGMSRLMNKNQCPMCRRALQQYALEPCLDEIETIIAAVMLKHNPHYHSWEEQELLQRFCTYHTKVIQIIYNKVSGYLEDPNSYNDIQDFVELSNFALKLKSSLEEIPQFQTDFESFRNKITELDAYVLQNPQLHHILLNRSYLNMALLS